MIRDELLGNDSPDGDTEQGPGSSSSTDEDAGDHSDEKKVQDDDDDSEQRLSESSIAHSLRHIALAFDEKSRELESLRKIQQTHDEECALLRIQLENKENERQDLITQLNDSSKNYTALQREVEALRNEIEHRDELLCFSDRISSRLFDMIHAIRAQVEAAESLSPAIRSLFTSPSTGSSQSENSSAMSTTEIEATSVLSEEEPNQSEAQVSMAQIFKEIEAKYSADAVDEV